MRIIILIGVQEQDGYVELLPVDPITPIVV
jgi:hypothetical protein